MKKLQPMLKKTLLAMCVLGGFQFANADTPANSSSGGGVTCNYTYNFRDTFTVVRQDRPVIVTKTDKTFGFSWAAKEYPTDASWEFKVNLTNADQVRVRLKYVKYDDNMYIYVNDQEIFGRVGGGVGGYNTDIDVGRYFKNGENTIRVRLVNNIPEKAAIGALFEYSEGGCTFTDLPRPPIKPLTDSARCIESLVCTEPKETRTFNGQPITRDCWNWETKRTCYDFYEDKSTCTVVPTEPSESCNITSKTCLEEKEYDVDGNKFKGCVRYETRYQCTKPVDPANLTADERQKYDAEIAARRSLCKPVQTCVGDNCYVQPKDRDEKDGDMAYVLALLQVGQQASTYMDLNNLKIFNGVASKCRSMRGFGALAKCCEVKSPVAQNSSGQNVNPTNDQVFENANKITNDKFNDPSSSYQDNYLQGGSNPYVYDSLYKPNEANYMLQGTAAMVDTEAGGYAMQNGGASTVTVMGYGYSPSETTTGDQSSFNSYSKTPNNGTPND